LHQLRVDFATADEKTAAVLGLLIEEVKWQEASAVNFR